MTFTGKTEHDVDPSRSTQSASWWNQIPDVWKATGVILGIGGTAIAGYAVLDDFRDGLEERIYKIEQTMVKSEDLGAYVGSETLKLESCIQRMRGQMHEYRALEKAYEELLQAIKLEEDVFLNRPLSVVEKERRDRIIELRSSFERRKFEITKVLIIN